MRPVLPRDPRPRSFTVGAHNLHDDATNVSAFADLLFFTESPKSKAGRRRMQTWLSGYDVKPCPQQRSLVIAYRKGGPFVPRGRASGLFEMAHRGLKRITPLRGTWAEVGTLNGEPAVLMVEHRINRSYKARPHSFRRRMWKMHQSRTARMVRKYQRKGYLVIVAGDTNSAPRGTRQFACRAYKGLQLRERGTRLDRIGVDRRLQASRVEYLSRHGSDHPRLRVTVTHS